jgi:uncharacterized membrane protein YiaA
VTRPTAAIAGASWAALVLGVVAFLVGLGNAEMERSEKGFYGLAFANVRDTLQSQAPPQHGGFQ